MKRLTMVVVFLVIGSVAAGAYWYWTQAASSRGAGGRSVSEKGEGQG